MLGFLKDIAIFVFLCEYESIRLFVHRIESVVRFLLHIDISLASFYIVLIVVPALTVWYELGNKHDLLEEDDYEL